MRRVFLVIFCVGFDIEENTLEGAVMSRVLARRLCHIGGLLGIIAPSANEDSRFDLVYLVYHRGVWKVKRTGRTSILASFHGRGFLNGLWITLMNAISYQFRGHSCHRG